MSEWLSAAVGYAKISGSVYPVFDCVLLRTQELQEAERAFLDVCDQIAKAERFFPVPGASAGSGTSTPPRGMPSGALSSWIQQCAAGAQLSANTASEHGVPALSSRMCCWGLALCKHSVRARSVLTQMPRTGCVAACLLTSSVVCVMMRCLVQCQDKQALDSWRSA